MPVILPFKPSNGHYTFSSLLRNTEYAFEVKWNSREAAYYFDVREKDGSPIARGLKLVLGAYMGRRVNHPLFRDGALVCRVPQGNDRRNPQLDDTGTRVQVWYFTRDEIVAEIRERLMGRGVSA